MNYHNRSQSSSKSFCSESAPHIFTAYVFYITGQFTGCFHFMHLAFACFWLAACYGNTGFAFALRVLEPSTDKFRFEIDNFSPVVLPRLF